MSEIGSGVGAGRGATVASCRQAGQAIPLLMGLLAAVLVGAFVLGAVARGVGARGTHQLAADLGALAGASRMRSNYERLFEPAFIGTAANPRHLSRAGYLGLGRAALER